MGRVKAANLTNPTLSHYPIMRWRIHIGRRDESEDEEWLVTTYHFDPRLNFDCHLCFVLDQRHQTIGKVKIKTLLDHDLSRTTMTHIARARGLLRLF